MSTWRMEQVKEVKDAEDVKDEDSVVESCLARNVASFGMVVSGYYTPRRR
jgi:hypothetical protein